MPDAPDAKFNPSDISTSLVMEKNAFGLSLKLNFMAKA